MKTIPAVIVTTWSGGFGDEPVARTECYLFKSMEAAVKWTKQPNQVWNEWREFEIEEKEILS